MKQIFTILKLFYNKVSLLAVLALLFFPLAAYAQVPDEPTREGEVEQRIENISESTQNELDYSDLFPELEYYTKHPINLNTATESDLGNLYMLNDIQISNLLDHIKKNGKLLSIYELQTIDGFDINTINDLLPYVKVSDEGKVKYNIKDMAKYSSSILIIRYQRIIEPQKGFSAISDSALAASPNSRYLGSPDKIYFRYRYKFYNKISFGITGDKDPGEQFFKGTEKQGFDFYSAHLMVNDMSIIKSIVIGDYQVKFGQGLTFWSGMGFGKSAYAFSVKKIALGLTPYTSVNEITFLRGAATTLAYKGIELTAFYSRKKIDANATAIDSTTGEVQYISSLEQTGIHATPAEIADRHIILEQIFGGHIQYSDRRLNVGVTACQSIYGASLTPTIHLYNQFDFTGNRNFNFGVDYSYIFRNINFFGEFGRSENGGMAFLDGIMLDLDEHISFSVLYRNYQKNYQSLYSSAFADGSYNANEEGIYTGLNIKFNPKWILSAYCDYFNSDWLRYQVNAPSKGQDYLGELMYIANKRLTMYFRYRYRRKVLDNTSIENIIDYPEKLAKQSIRYDLSYQLSKTFSIKDRVELSAYHQASKPMETGYLVYQDIRYKPEKLPFSLSARYGLFATDSYYSSIYSLENDMPGAYSVPSLYYKGSRFYIMAKFDIGRHIDLWLRYDITYYSNKNVISSGLSEIDKNHKSEIKAQVQMKF